MHDIVEYLRDANGDDDNKDKQDEQDGYTDSDSNDVSTLNWCPSTQVSIARGYKYRFSCRHNDSREGSLW